MKSKFKALLQSVGIPALIGLVAFLLARFGVLYPLDKLISDPLYQTPSAPDPRIKIIAVDETTLAKYGDITQWSRGLSAQLVDLLNADPAYAPAVLAFDIMYISSGEADPAGDARFAESCAAAGNVITAAHAVYRDDVTLTEQGTLSVNQNAVAMVEYPYPALKQAAGYAFANTVQDTDGYIRCAQLSLNYQGETIDSLAWAICQRWCAAQGITPTVPRQFGPNRFFFTYSGPSGSYEAVPLVDVLEGRVDPRAFAGCVVLVGAYATGMQDAYNAPNQKGSQMYGVEVHASILESLMEGTTGVPVSDTLYALLVALLAVAFYLGCSRLKLALATAAALAMIAADLAVCALLYRAGHVTRLIELPIMVLAGYICCIISRYLLEALRRRQVVNAFKKYVAPQVVDAVSKKGEFKLELGGQKRHIAVLFVDIRGFTPMSEGLQPEQVVEILNEYLALTTGAIFKNGGTLDKYIGDATMAVFNAPFDLDDYVYRAVCTARDIAAGSEELEKKLMARFGKSVSFGIGVNCGDAVVGNIGCDFRMDYTAIGDTVNTAARLEANAKRGQILISDAVYQTIKDRVEVTDIGVIPLKGKSNEIFVYQVDRVL